MSPARALRSLRRMRRAPGVGGPGHSALDRLGSRADRSAVIDECLMTEDCPGYDRDLRACLIRPGDCEFNLADGEAALTLETPEALTPDASPEAGSR